jgi:hypothetical protein
MDWKSGYASPKRRVLARFGLEFIVRIWFKIMLKVALDHFFCHLAYRSAKIAARPKCRPQYLFFRCENSSNNRLGVFPLIRFMISLGAIFGGALTKMCT